MAGRVTQRDIAAAARVSQATVSLVLNGRGDALAAETRNRVLAVIKETGYVPNPAARQLQGGRNRILGVFTYEAVFPSSGADFYNPFFVGIEEAAEALGLDLLLFTSASAANGRRRIFGDENRLRLADGCILLGRSIDRAELTRLNSESYPFVTVGRRDDAGGPVPYVGADYAVATADLVRRARQLGHESFAYVGPGVGAEGSADRLRGYLHASVGVASAIHVAEEADPGTLVTRLVKEGVTALLVEEAAYAVAVVAAARSMAIDVPAHLSVLALGDPTRPVVGDAELTGFRIPRAQMGRTSVDVLATLLEHGREEIPQLLLPCDFVEGGTLGVPRDRGTSPARPAQ